MYSFVSLGSHCFPRRFIDKYGLQQRNSIRMPFDGSLHPIDCIEYLIDNDFDNYLNLNYIKTITTSSGMEILGNFHPNIRSSFNHERSLDINIFIEQLTKRVEQFREHIKTKNCIFIILHDKVPQNLINILDKYVKSYHLFIFNKVSDCNETNVNIISDKKYTFCDIHNDSQKECEEILLKQILGYLYTDKDEYNVQLSNAIKQAKLYNTDIYYD